MASLLKNQILKHLSRFTKNLSPDKISLSALKGEGELANLELDETVLMDILELPTWLRLSKAKCNRVGIKIQWTKLKTQPICLYLDEVVLEVETCEEPRPPNNPQVSNISKHLRRNLYNQQNMKRPGKYGFVERVIDGIYVHINSVQVFFLSKTFQACLQMSRVKVQSVSPTWQATNDLRLTRIKDVSRGEVIIFKEVDWQATRIEAQAVDPQAKGVITQTPIRLIANQAKLRIAVKKNINDCSIVSSRVILLLDDLLWVLTETQLKAALLYATSLQEVIEKSTRQSKQLAAEKLKRQGHISSDQLKRLQQMQQNKAMPSKVSRVFSKFDVLSTSYHLITSRIDLHLCDDMQPRNDATHNSRIEGGAMQITLNKLSVDYYPFNPADENLIMSRGDYFLDSESDQEENDEDGDSTTEKEFGGERKQWYRYSDQVGSRNHWVGQLFARYKEEIQRAKVAYGWHSPSQSPTHSEQQSSSSSTCSSSSSSTSGATGKSQTSPIVSNVSDRSPGSTSSSTTPSQGRPPPSGSGSSSSGGGGRTTSRLLESCMVLEIEEFTIYCISTADQKRNSPHKFFSSEKKVLHLPHDMPIVHLEYTEYYFPEGIDFPVPHANLYTLVNPVQLRIDYLTLLWVNYFLLQLSKNLESFLANPVDSMDSADPSMNTREDQNQKEGADGPREHVDIKFEALMPKILINAEGGSPQHSSERPDTLIIQMSKISATNNRAEPHSSRDKLLSILNEQSKSYMFKTSEFPMDDNANVVCPQQVCAHALSKDCIDAYIDPEFKRILTTHKTNLPQADNIPVYPTTPNGDRIKLRTNSLKLDSAYDVWNMDIDQIWMDFTTRRSRPVPFVESFPMTLWFWRTLPTSRSKTNTENHEEVMKNGDVTRDRSSSQESNYSDYGKKINSDFSLSSPRSSSTSSSKSRDRSESPPVRGSSSRSSSCDRNKPSSGPSKSSAPRCVLSGKREHMDIYAIASVQTKVQVLLTHYQYLFVLRLAESLSTFQKQLTADTEYFSGNSISPSISLTSIVHDVEVAMIFQKPCESNNHSGNATGGLSGTIKGSIAELPTMDKESAMEGWNNAEVDNYDDPIGLISKSYSDSRLNLSKQEMTNGELPIQSAQMDAIRISDLSLESNNTLGNQYCSSISSSTLSLAPSIAYSAAADSVYATASSTSSDSKLMLAHPSLRKGQIKTEKKKTLSSAWSNFTDKLRSMGEGNDDSIFGSEDSEPGQTDYSSDDESFEHLSLEDAEETPAFERKPNLDPQRSFDSISHDSSSETLSTAREKLQIHVTVFHLSEVEVLAQTFGNGTVLRSQLNNIDIIEISGLTWEGFHRKFTSSQESIYREGIAITSKKTYFPDGIPYESVSMSEKQFPVRLKYMIGPGLPALKYDEIAQERGFLHVNLADMRLTFQMSTLINLAALLEDELPPVFMPLYINIEDMTLTLQEDRPSSSSPMTPPPTVLSLHQAIVDRGADGVFHIRGANNIPVKIGLNEVDKSAKVGDEKMSASQNAAISNSNRIIEQLWKRNTELEKDAGELKNEATQKMEQLQAKLSNLEKENEELKSTIGNRTNMSAEHVDSIEQENLNYLERISYLEEELHTSNKEKDSLLATMHLLQEELLASEHQRSVKQVSSPTQ